MTNKAILFMRHVSNYVPEHTVDFVPNYDCVDECNSKESTILLDSPPLHGYTPLVEESSEPILPPLTPAQYPQTHGHARRPSKTGRPSHRPKGTGQQSALWEQASVALLTHRSVEEAAHKIGVTAATLKRWLKDPEFSTQLDEIRREYLAQQARRIQGASQSAVDTLVALMENEATPPAVRRACAKDILEIVQEMAKHEKAAEEARRAIERMEGMMGALGLLPPEPEELPEPEPGWYERLGSQEAAESPTVNREATEDEGEVSDWVTVESTLEEVVAYPWGGEDEEVTDP